MTWTPTEPAWAAPPRSEINDFQWLAYRAHAEHGSVWAAGAAAAVAWVRGGQAAPVTERADAPVSRAAAVAELWTAAAVCRVGPPPQLDQICDRLGVAYRAPRPVARGWAEGAWQTLRWLTGAGDPTPPIALPVRLADGRVPTADELFEFAVAAAPEVFRRPEDRAALRLSVEGNARRYRELADLVAETQHLAAAPVSARRGQLTHRAHR